MQNTADIAGSSGEPGLSGGPLLGARLSSVIAIARHHADAVDREGRFPSEAMAELRAQRLLGVMIPRRFGGEGASLGEVADLCFGLGRACGSTAMIFAMHHINLACLVGHHQENPWQTGFLRRTAERQGLLASSTTEGGAGGAVRRSEAPIEATPLGVSLSRAASVISYGEEADAVVTTARRDGDAAASDQVLVVFQRRDYQLARRCTWNAMGMRGTCSHGFAFEARGVPDQILPVAYADIHALTMTPYAHALWGALWAGMAAEAVERARLYLRRAARAAPDALPPGAAHLAEARASLQTLRALVSGFIDRHERLQAQPAAISALEHQIAIATLKVEASRLAQDIALKALGICGLSGYRNDGDVSVARILRDVMSAPLMISNDRILRDLSGAVLLERGSSSLSAHHSSSLTGSLDQ